MSYEPSYLVIEDPQGGAEQQLFLVHGILGSSKNWRAFCQRFVALNPTWRIVLVDLPAHGMNREAPPPYDLPACGRLILSLVKKLGAPRALIGHSFGGKVVTEASIQLSDNPLGVAVLDCPLLAMESVTRSNSEIGKVIQIIGAIDQPVFRRSTVSELFQEAGFTKSLSGWMATNLIKNPDGEGYVWHFLAEAIPDLLEDYWSKDYHQHLEDPGKEREFLLLKAAQSDRFGPEELAKSQEMAEAGRIQWQELPDAGHWLHIDNPDGLLSVLKQFLSQLY